MIFTTEEIESQSIYDTMKYSSKRKWIQVETLIEDLEKICDMDDETTEIHLKSYISVIKGVNSDGK
jgi:hypothetical protein